MTSLHSLSALSNFKKDGLQQCWNNQKSTPLLLVANALGEEVSDHGSGVLKVAVSGMRMCKLFVMIINADLLYTSRLICTAGHVCLVLKLLNGQCDRCATDGQC